MKINSISGKASRSAFTLVELLVALGLVIILVSILLPYVQKLREADRRERCAANLYQIRDALRQYALANRFQYPRVRYDQKNHPNGHTAFTGADEANPFRADSTVAPNDVTASLWLLVRGGLVRPDVFVCPSAGGQRDLLTNAAGRVVPATQRGNFRLASSLSYGYSTPFSAAINYRMDDTGKSDFAILADKAPGFDFTTNAGSRGPLCWMSAPAHDAPPLKLSVANSRNHNKAGQNVLYADGSVSFEKTVYCGVGRASGMGGDNIFTALEPVPLKGQTPPANGNGYWGPEIGPSWESDSMLVPTEDEGSR